MRICLLMLGLAIGSYALTPQDIQGMWKGTIEGDPTSVVEMFFGTDGKTEMRMKASFLGLTEIKMNGLGDWTVNGDTVYVRSTGGYMQFGTEPPEPLDTDPVPVGQKTTLIPGNPRKLQMEDCEDGDCIIQEVSYVGAAKTFTLPPTGPGASIWSGKARFESAQGIPVNGTGRSALRVFKNGRAFDLMGRPAR
jgi:hypothetical protein